MALSSAVAQEGVGRVSSYIWAKLEDKASRAHHVMRLELALSQLEFALERTAKKPITYISLLRRWNILKQAHKEGTDLLKKHKLQLLTDERQEPQNDHGVGRAVTRFSFPLLEQIFGRARNWSISSLLGLSEEGYLSSSVIKIFEQYAVHAEKFVTDVEYGCPLRHDNFFYPLERQLLKGKILVYGMVKGGQSHFLYMCPICLEGRGVEVHLDYSFNDYMMRRKVTLLVVLRLSQGTNIIGTLIRCLQFVTESLKLPTSSLLKCVIEPAIGEITLLSSSLGSRFRRCMARLTALIRCLRNASYSRKFRPDPICCASNVASLHSTYGVPEPVIYICFTQRISETEYMLHSSTDEVAGKNAPLLFLRFEFKPHASNEGPQENRVQFEGKEERISGSGSGMQLMQALLQSGINYLARQPEQVKYVVGWSSPHGGASLTLEKESTPKIVCLKPTAVRRSGRIAAKRKR